MTLYFLSVWECSMRAHNFFFKNANNFFVLVNKGPKEWWSPQAIIRRSRAKTPQNKLAAVYTISKLKHYLGLHTQIWFWPFVLHSTQAAPNTQVSITLFPRSIVLSQTFLQPSSQVHNCHDQNHLGPAYCWISAALKASSHRKSIVKLGHLGTENTHYLNFRLRPEWL